MAPKRKRGIENDVPNDVVVKPAAGTKSFTSGTAIKKALSTGSRQSFIAFYQQIATPHSALPLAINHATTLILQHYLAVSPNCEEIFGAWQQGVQIKNDKQVDASVALLAEIIKILTPLPFFQTQLSALVNKIVSNTEPYHDFMNRLIQSGKREQSLAGLQLASAALNVDPPSLTGSLTVATGRGAIRVWTCLVDGGSLKGMGKLLGMRKRTKDGEPGYGSRDPLDKADIRHLALSLILPVLGTSSFQIHAKSILPHIYSNLPTDPPVTVYRILTAMFAAMSHPSAGTARRIALALQDENALEQILKLLNRDDMEDTTGRTVSDIASAFLQKVTATPGQGICFPDQGWYPRKTEGDDGEREPEGHRKKASLHNRILSNVVGRLHGKVVDDNGRLGEWTRAVFMACPELVAGYWPHSALSLDPRLNAKWMATMAFVGHIISLPPPPLTTFYASNSAPKPNPPCLSTMIESIIPSPLHKAHLTKGLEHPDGLVQHMTALTLGRALQKLERVQKLFEAIEAEIESEPSSSAENAWIRRRRELEMEARKRVPDLQCLIAFAQRSAQSAPPEPETEQDFIKVTRSHLLTESALRLFGLYHATLPTLAQETKFDVGKLLVSSSSASAERRARREAREGSVISDDGSVGSVGTLGTVGMGGGFGQARGEVHGFEALSQVHVLRLLSQVDEWNWVYKAAGSQYTYLYHILQLHLSTNQHITFETTSLLLQRLLSRSILFEHDPSELEIWLSSMPRASPAISGPTLLVQQIHLLSFLDDCVRRAMKTPYRYIEDLQTLRGSNVVDGNENLSPVMSTVLEQFDAKVMGQHIATDAAGVVLAYLRRVMLGLAGKQSDGETLEGIAKRIEATLVKAKDAGQARVGLSELLEGIKGDLRFPGSGRRVTGDVMELADESMWRKTSFEAQAVTLSALQWADQQCIDDLPTVSAQSTAANLRHGRFLLHLLSSSSDLSTAPAALETVLKLLNRLLDSGAKGLKTFVFEDATIRKLFLGVDGSPIRSVLEDLAATLSVLDSSDLSLAEPYVESTLETLIRKPSSTALDVLNIMQPWIRFFSSEQAKEALECLISQTEKKSIDPSNRIRSISALVIQTADATFVVKHLTHLLSWGVVEPLTRLIKEAALQRDHLEIDSETILQIINLNSDPAYELLSTMTEHFPTTSESLQSVLGKRPDVVKDLRLLSCVEILLDSGKTQLQPSQIISTATKAVVTASLPAGVHESATRILLSLATSCPTDVVTSIMRLVIADFGEPLVRFGERLARLRDVECMNAVEHIVDLGLQVAVRHLSDDAPLREVDVRILMSLANTIRIAETLDLKPHLVEPMITAVVQERLESAEAMDLASLLTAKTMLKAGFIRQNLQLIFSSLAYSRQTRSTISRPLRTSFISLVHKLFLASTYVSCQPTYIESLLPLYHGSLGQADQMVLSLFQVFEQNRKLSVGSVLKTWAAGGTGSSKALDALTSLDAQRVFATCTAFPLRRSWRTNGLDASTSEDPLGEDLYDPLFLLALISFALNEGNVTGLDWVEILRSNVLGIAACALSSRDENSRAMGSYILAKTMSMISVTGFLERPQMLYTLRVLRHSIPASPNVTINPPRLPMLATLFFAHTLRAIAHPAHFIYPHLSRHLLQRPTYDLFDVPGLYNMLYASGEGWKRERGWILRLLRDGIKSEADWRVVRRRHVWGLLAGLYQGSLDVGLRRSVLQVMTAMTRIPTGARSLINHSSVIPWLIMQWDMSIARPTRVAEEERKSLLELLENVIVYSTGSRPLSAQSSGVEHTHTIGEAEADVDLKRSMKWLGEVEVLVKKVANCGPEDSLETLSRIVLRLSDLPSSSGTVAVLVACLAQFIPASPSKTTSKTIEHLFRAGLSLSDLSLSEEVASALRLLKSRILKVDGDIGDWARRQMRAVA